MSRVSILPPHIAAAHARTLKAITDGILFPAGVSPASTAPAPHEAAAVGATPFPTDFTRGGVPETGGINPELFYDFIPDDVRAQMRAAEPKHVPRSGPALGETLTKLRELEAELAAKLYATTNPRELPTARNNLAEIRSGIAELEGEIPALRAAE